MATAGSAAVLAAVSLWSLNKRRFEADGPRVIFDADDLRAAAETGKIA
jgi:hypothetical protein